MLLFHINSVIIKMYVTKAFMIEHTFIVIVVPLHHNCSFCDIYIFKIIYTVLKSSLKPTAVTLDPLVLTRRLDCHAEIHEDVAVFAKGPK